MMPRDPEPTPRGYRGAVRVVQAIRIRGVADLNSLPKANVRSSYLSEDSEGSPEAQLAVLRVIATWEQDSRDGVEPREEQALPDLLEEAVAALDAEGLELWGAVREPGVAPIEMDFPQIGVKRVTEATLVVIRFSIQKVD